MKFPSDMKNFDLASMGVQEMNSLEMKETDGGILLWLVIGFAAFCLSGCSVNISNNFGDGNTCGQGAATSVDSTANGNSYRR